MGSLQNMMTMVCLKFIVSDNMLLLNLEEMDVTQNDIQLEMKGFVFAPAEKLLVSQGTLGAPKVGITE